MKIIILRYDVPINESVQVITISEEIYRYYHHKEDDISITIADILDKEYGISEDEYDWKQLPDDWNTSNIIQKTI